MAKIKKTLTKIEKEKKEKFVSTIKKMAKKPKVDNLATSMERKVDAVDFYQSLSETEKTAFKKELKRKKIRDNYIKYLKYVYPNYIVTKFHSMLANLCQSVVEKIEHGEKVYLCLSVPPQHGKSMTVTETLPSWFIGRNPDLRCIVTAYNADVAEKFGDKNRQLIKQYGKELFNVEISDSQDNKTLWDIKGKQGGMLSAGILGGLTSNGGALVIVDDPFKNGQEAENGDLRDKVYSVFSDSVYTRARGVGCAIIIIHTRWHEDDLIGRLCKQHGWTYVNIPCVWEEGMGEDRLLHRKVGQTLCPELGFDANWADTTMKILGKRKWNALYQGKPFIDGGNLVKRDDIKFYNSKTRPSAFEELTLSCDLSFGGTKSDNDPYCMTLWGRNGGDHYLLKIWDKRASFMETKRTLRVICSQYPQLKRKIIEKKAMGGPIIEELGREIGGFIPFDPKGASKEARFSSVTPYFEGGNIHFPDESLEPNIELFIEQVLKFPNVGHDDFVDTISQYLLNYEYKYGGKIAIGSGFKAISQAIRGLKI